MKLKKFFTAVCAAVAIAVSQTAPVAALFEKNEVTLYESEIFQQQGVSVAADAQWEVYHTGGSVVEVPVKFLGFTVGTKKVTVKEDRQVWLGGQAVGVAMYTKGLFVTDTVAVQNTEGKFLTPAANAGIRKGDYILSANGVNLDDVSTIDAVLKACGGEEVTLKVQRDATSFEVSVMPVKSIEDQQYRLGLWMRDSAAGLGTVTYVDTKDNSYMALGHAICDGDSGKILSVGNGRIVDCTISSVQKGSKGNAGELKGSFGVGAQVLGTIEENTLFGLKGTADENFQKGELVNLGSKELVHEGEAEIYSTVDSGGVKKYKIEIVHVNNQTHPQEKSMVIHVTDPELLDKTGGIVQGMSGSPIVQDGKLIGAVTHVMLSDSSRGYGIFIDWMMD